MKLGGFETTWSAPVADSGPPKTDPPLSEAAAAAARSAPIDLAREADFALGAAIVRPSLSEVVIGDQTIRLQPRVMQVLVALVRAGGEVVSRDDLLASCWGGLAIGDDAINRCIGRLRRLAEEEIPGAFAIETLPRIGYRLSRGDEGAPARAVPVRRRHSVTTWRVAAAVVLALVLAGSGWFLLGLPGWPESGAGVAVMPFDTEPGDALTRDFADGVADEVASTLTSSDLKAAPADTGAGLTRLERDAVSTRLGAAFTLGGRVQRDGAALAVTVVIDDARRHEVLWSSNFSRPANQAQAMQEQVAAKVANVLHCALDARNFQGGRIDPDTLRLYLHACDVLGSGDVARIRDAFQQVLTREPQFGRAWANFAMANAVWSEQLPPDQAATARQEARSDATRAIQLDPTSGIAYVALSLLAPPPGHLMERQALLLKGLALSPDTAPLNYRECELLEQAGRYNEAVVFERRAVVLDPLDSGFTASLAGDLAMGGRVAEARALFERDMRIWPDDSDLRGMHIGTEARFGDPSAGVGTAERPKNGSERLGGAVDR